MDRTFRDLRDRKQIFGGILTILSGDWCQILPVAKNSNCARIVDACPKSSRLWPGMIALQLETNTRVKLYQEAQAAEFSAFLLRTDDGEPPVIRELGEDTSVVPEQIRSPATSVVGCLDFP